MPEKDFVIWIDDRVYIKAEFLTARGRMLWFVVRLMWKIGSKDVNVARYDMAHGVPHRDLLGRRSGLINKTWFPDQMPETVFAEAIRDFRMNYESYIQEFAGH